jgi:hypothetical protein
MSFVGGTQGLCVLTYCRLHPRVMPRVANDRGGVAGVVAQRGGEVDRPCPAERADDEVAQPDPIHRALQAEQLPASAARETGARSSSWMAPEPSTLSRLWSGRG